MASRSLSKHVKAYALDLDITISIKNLESIFLDVLLKYVRNLGMVTCLFLEFRLRYVLIHLS